MCFLLSARVSCLLYSSHMAAGCRAPPGISPLQSLRPRREPADCLSCGPSLTSQVGSSGPGRRRQRSVSTSRGHLPFKSCPAFALRQAPPCSSPPPPGAGRASACASHPVATPHPRPRSCPRLTRSLPALLPTSPPHSCYFS